MAWHGPQKAGRKVERTFCVKGRNKLRHRREEHRNDHWTVKFKAGSMRNKAQRWWEPDWKGLSAWLRSLHVF